MNFHHMSHTNFPSSAAVASKDWSNYSDHLEIPSLVLMEHMQRGRGITEIIFVSFKSLGNILQSQAPKSEKKWVSFWFFCCRLSLDWILTGNLFSLKNTNFYLGHTQPAFYHTSPHPNTMVIFVRKCAKSKNQSQRIKAKPNIQHIFGKNFFFY